MSVVFRQRHIHTGTMTHTKANVYRGILARELAYTFEKYILLTDVNVHSSHTHTHTHYDEPLILSK